MTLTPATHAAAHATPAVVEEAPQPSHDDWLLDEERRQISWLLSVAILGAIAFAIADLQFTGPQRVIYPLLRILMVTLMVAALVAVRRHWATGPTRGLIAAATLGIGLFLFGRYAAGDGHGAVGGDTSTDVVVILAIFMLPQRLAVQSAAVLLIIAGAAIDFIHWKQFPPLQIAQLLLILSFAAAIGMAFARAQRAGLEERWTSQQEIRELRALIPICAWCKNIRTDEGAWERIESYFHRHGGGAAFTHAICPQCMTDMDAVTEYHGQEGAGI